jgi:hypothetical protein
MALCDGFGNTVTYASLNHCARWRNEIPKLKIEELEGAEHRQVLANRLFFKCVFLSLHFSFSLSLSCVRAPLTMRDRRARTTQKADRVHRRA